MIYSQITKFVLTWSVKELCLDWTQRLKLVSLLFSFSTLTVSHAIKTKIGYLSIAVIGYHDQGNLQQSVLSAFRFRSWIHHHNGREQGNRPVRMVLEQYLRTLIWSRSTRLTELTWNLQFFFLKPQNPPAGSYLPQGHVPNPSQVVPIPEE